jgi:hypothetical protein
VDPVKIVIFLAVFALLLVIGRMLSASSEVHAAQLPRPEPQPGAAPAENDTGNPDFKRPPVTGAEIDFPIQLPPVAKVGDGIYNRPIVRNYFFSKTDLIRGPADPSSFCDEFFIELQDPESKHVWTDDYTVATPAGLQQVMTSEKFDSVYLAGNVVIVARWDLRMILHTIMDETMKSYGQQEVELGDQPAAPETTKISRWGHLE